MIYLVLYLVLYLERRVFFLAAKKKTSIDRPMSRQPLQIVCVKYFSENELNQCTMKLKLN
jgi:hypothetical protein